MTTRIDRYYHVGVSTNRRRAITANADADGMTNDHNIYIYIIIYHIDGSIQQYTRQYYSEAIAGRRG